MAKGITFHVENKIHEVLVEKALELTNNLLAGVMSDVVPLTPVGKSKKNYTGGRLRKGWGITPASLRGNVVIGYVYNSTHYAGHVNYGHRTRLGSGRPHSYMYYDKKGRRHTRSMAMSTNLYHRDGTTKKRVVKGKWFVQEALRKNGFRVNKVGGYR